VNLGQNQGKKIWGGDENDEKKNWGGATVTSYFFFALLTFFLIFENLGANVYPEQNA
jgi:hypothetical protein